MNKHMYWIIGGVVIILAVGVASWFLFQDTSPVAQNTEQTNVQESSVDAGIRATLAYLQGTVDARIGQDEWSAAQTDDVLREGDSIRTGENSKAILELDNGDIIRLGYSTEITLTSSTDELIDIAQKQGAIYCRVAADQTRVFEVTSEGATIQALGTAFDVVVTDEKTDVTVIEHSVKIKTGTDEQDVEQGKIASIQNADKTVALGQVDESKLENDWYAWNKEEDQAKSKDLGILAPKETAEEQNSQQEQSQNTNQNTEEKKITLSGVAKTTGISLTWEITGFTPEYGFKLVRGTAENPTYPGSEYVHLSPNDSRSYTWEVRDGKTYHFRVCQFNGSGECLVYSNNISVKAEDPAVEVDEEEQEEPTYSGPNLSVSATADGVNMWWSDKSANPGFKYYKVVRSETKAEPVYPDDGYIAVKSKGEEHYSDKSAIKGTWYYYRICAVGDQVYCGQVQRVKAVHTNDAPAAVTLSASVSGDSVVLTWTKSAISDFKYYKVVWSQTDSTPTYPENGYLSWLPQTTLTYTHESDDDVDVLDGTHYYAVCVVDTADQVTCSNVETIEDGVVQ